RSWAMKGSGSRVVFRPPDSGRRSGTGLLVLQPHLVVASGLVVFEPQQPLSRSVFDELGKTLVAVIRLVKAGMHAADGLFDLRTPQRLVVFLQRAHDLDQLLDGFLLLVGVFVLFLVFVGGLGLRRASGLRFLDGSDQVVVV